MAEEFRVLIEHPPGAWNDYIRDAVYSNLEVAASVVKQHYGYYTYGAVSIPAPAARIVRREVSAWEDVLPVREDV